MPFESFGVYHQSSGNQRIIGNRPDPGDWMVCADKATRGSLSDLIRFFSYALATQKASSYGNKIFQAPLNILK